MERRWESLISSTTGCGSACEGGIGVGTRSISSRDELELNNVDGGSVSVDPDDDESGVFCRFLTSRPRQASISSTSSVSDSPSDLSSELLAEELGSTDFLRTPEGCRRIPSTLSLVECLRPRASAIATPSGLRIFLIPSARSCLRW